MFPCAFEPLEHQVNHINNIINAFNEHFGVIDISLMGNGKTYTTTYLSCLLELPMLIICPSALIKVWEGMEKMGAQTFGIYTYNGLGGQSNHKYTFPFLTRKVETINEKKYVSFHPSARLLQLIDQGVLIVMDETSKIKNKNSLSTNAVQAIVDAIVTSDTRSRLISLSATLYDKEEFKTNTLRNLGYTSESSLSTYDVGTGLHDPKGLLQVIDVCERYNRRETQVVLARHQSIGKKTKVNAANTIAGELFIEVMKPLMVFAMPNPILARDFYTLYGNMSKLEFGRYSIAVQNLAELLLFNDANDQIREKLGKGTLQKLALIMRDLEHSKVGIMAREAYKTLMTDPNAKVIVNFNYTTTLPMFLERFGSFGTGIVPAMLHGKIKQSKRDEAITQFQAPNNYLRMIVATIGTGSMGISLHDLDGRFPRTTYMMPSWSIQNLHQASGRTARSGAKSIATVAMVYGKRCDQAVGEVTVKEQRILDALARKEGILKQLAEGVATGDSVLFPNEYPVRDEPTEPGLLNDETKYYNDIGINGLTSKDMEEIKSGRSSYVPLKGEDDPLIMSNGVVINEGDEEEEED